MKNVMLVKSPVCLVCEKNLCQESQPGQRLHTGEKPFTFAQKAYVMSQVGTHW